MDFNFSHNFNKTRSLFAYFWEEYLKVDFKYLIKPFIILFIALLGFTYYGFFLQKFTGGIAGLFSFLGTIILNTIFFFWSAYFLNRTVYSKAFHIYQGYNNPQLRYKENLRFYQTSPVKYSQRPIIWIIISFFLGILINYLYIYLNFQFNTSLSGIVYFLEIGSILMIGLLFVVPFKQFLFLLRSNGYIEPLDEKHSFVLLDSWKNKLKFILLELVCINILGIILEVLFYIFLILAILVSGILAVVFIFVLIGLVSTLGIASVSAFPLTLVVSIIIILFILCFSFFFVIGVELEGSLIGTLYGQTFVNLTNPNLEYVKVKKTD